MKNTRTNILSLALLVLSVLTLGLAAPSFAQSTRVCRPFVGTGLTGKDYAKFLPTTAKMLTDTPSDGVAMPATTTEVLIFVNTQPIRYRTGGVNPTSTTGVLVQPGTVLRFDLYHMQQARAFRFIEAASGAEVDASFCY